ncbi:cyclic nucleotide-binding domain-containing protein [Trichophyton equinum CBS 127.97]|uniref:Cyclic nucleotide-binding domain-containing protein n=1 Tax=Trichophyton equinum (strain ATCC MYA-4606 / CBS 127.97) TaxID=559882 RepID=F2PI37_TRIEC|nr:cyclic nucleotide-binding domain-containing protein [Trichophyton equinum CBS 127.97]
MRRHGRGSASPLSAKTATAVPDPMSPIRTFNTEMNPSRPVRPSPLAASQIRGMPLDIIDRIRSFPLFQSTPESFLTEIGLHLRPQINSANDYILTEGDDAKAMYWLVRGAVVVTSRDGESTYAELKPGAFFGEIGVLMDRPRTATIIARTRCLLLILTKEDFRNILPRFPEVERAIRDEAEERLQILERKKQKESPSPPAVVEMTAPGGQKRVTKRVRDTIADGLDFNNDEHRDANSFTKKRKSPSPSCQDVPTYSALANGLVSVRMLLRELPLFANLPADILHFLGLNAQPRTYPPFTDIIRQNSPGREVFFIVRGEVEVLNERCDPGSPRRVADAEDSRNVQVKARLKQGQYFGEVVSLSLAPRRTATVRSVSAVECLMLSGEVLSEFWARCPADIRDQVERTARTRLDGASDGDVVMEDAPSADQLFTPGNQALFSARRQSMPLLTFSETELESLHKPNRMEDESVVKPSDPDPFLSVGLDNVRSRSRRGSLAPIIPEDTAPDQQSQSQATSVNSRSRTPSPNKYAQSTLFRNSAFFQTKPSKHRNSIRHRGVLSNDVLVSIFQYLELHVLLRLRGVARQWCEIVTKSPRLLHFLDLSRYNRKITDEIITGIICPFVGDRPRVIDTNNCFHVTDEGFSALANTCGANLRVLKMKSVWDVTAPTILDMTNHAKSLQEIDLSNCRKVSDTLLARIVGWVVPAPQQNQNHVNGGRALQNSKYAPKAGAVQQPNQPAAGTVYGCPYLKKITLSYCKHVTDRSMHHIASHAANRLEEVDLTRCTTITDQGFQYWGNAQFLRLRKLCLADCTYLTDNAIVYLTNSAKCLQELDLSFCCALSDTATEVLALGCPQLTHLNLSFCGSAVSDPSLRSIGLHLLNLRELSVRGCVRVTGTGVEAVADGCSMLSLLDVSQCKNLSSWLEYGFQHRYRDRIEFITVAHNGKRSR